MITLSGKEFQIIRHCTRWLLRSNVISSSPEHVLKVFSHLMLKGQLRSAVSGVTECMHTGGVLHPSYVVENGSKSVLEVLENKHPEPSSTGADAFMPCDTLPPPH